MLSAEALEYWEMIAELAVPWLMEHIGIAVRAADIPLLCLLVKDR
jgi:hypothetical protein